jgi:RND family efflux transporter MFP subunit
MEIKQYGLVVLALLGVIFSLFMIFYGLRKPPVAPISFAPPIPPYAHYIAAEGIIESAYKNISLGVPFNRLVSEIYVQVGDTVQTGSPLFKLDTRELEAQKRKAEQELQVAHADFEDKQTQFSFYERLCDKKAASEQMYQQAFYAKEIARQKLQTAQASVAVITTDIERSTIHAPIDGQVLQLNIRVGEFAQDNTFSNQPLILFGDTQKYHLRIQIDEENAWRYEKGAPAIAYVRGNAKISIPLSYVYIEPYIIPKKNLTGSDIQRVDTRVLEVVYSFEKHTLPIYAGQLLDVYIQAKPNELVA